MTLSGLSRYGALGPVSTSKQQVTETNETIVTLADAAECVWAGARCGGTTHGS